MNRLQMPDDMPIEHKMVTRAVARAQTQVESRNFELRKNVLKYDDVMNEQRKVVYNQRSRVLEGNDDDVAEVARDFMTDALATMVGAFASTGQFSEEWDLDELRTALEQLYPVQLDFDSLDREFLTVDGLIDDVLADARERYAEREKKVGASTLREVERRVILNVVDRIWREHLYEMDHLREGIGLRAVGQRDPLVEYQREAYDAFSVLMARVKEEAVGYFFNFPVENLQAQQPPREDGDRPASSRIRMSSAASPQVSPRVAASQAPPTGTPGASAAAAAKRATQGTVVKGDRVGRNDPCPCGSGLKYKKCHGT
jgi:preprotein translocase subunit SecA